MEVVELVLSPAEAGDEKLWPKRVARKLRVKPERVKEVVAEAVTRRAEAPGEVLLTGGSRN